ncbi:hypothetical protein PRECH8_27510 [Insulibacter thermoxylanivorax]|uniref:Chitin-binding type-3 domain-containing protein n=1 Tax=Insulibacter thermoxylanivorax TaxID=2749268 RepID=A0A916VIL3_9BACL|nr:carbohydrate-binding protein [Insulibacter thermoxylanivorax]GFR39455.1 hypothetical protein PRECH8_27510 [Insulibacter thermoxylanivorax]
MTEYPVWDPNVVYTNEIVIHNGKLWQALWWTQGQEPGTTGPWGPWILIGDAPGYDPDPVPVDDYPAWDPTVIYINEIVSHNGRLYQSLWWNQGVEPGLDQNGPWRLIH